MVGSNKMLENWNKLSPVFMVRRDFITLTELYRHKRQQLVESCRKKPAILKVIIFHLDIQVGKRAIFIRRLLWNEGQPAIYRREYLVYAPLRPIVEAELEATALQQLFSGSSGSLLKYGEVNIEATLLDGEEARLLQVPSPMATFCFERLFYAFENRPVSWGWFIGRADRLRFTTQVGLLSE